MFCAYYPSWNTTLDQAQAAKLELVCRKLGLKPGDEVVEAGSGWGGLARYLALHHGVTVRSYNISKEQVAWAREECDRRGLGDRVEFRLEDYRDIQGRYDVFVSIGMLEHVGTKQYDALGRVIDRSLGPDGRGLLHYIGRARPMAFSRF